MGLRKVLRDMFKKQEYISNRDILISNLLLSTSVSIIVTFGVLIAYEVIEGGTPMIEVLNSWKWYVIIGASYTTFIMTFILLKYANKTEQDRTIARIDSSLTNIETKLDTMITAINRLADNIEKGNK